MSSPTFGAAPAASLILASGFWAAGTVISKAMLTSVSPITLLIVQLAPSVIVLWLIAYASGARSASTRSLVIIILLGFLNPGLAYTFSMLGLARTTAGVASLLWAAEPALVIVMARLVIGERLHLGLIATVVVAFVGVLLVAGPTGNGEGIGWGNGLVLMGVSCCALYTVLSRKIVSDISPLFIVATQQSAGLICALCVWPFFEDGQSRRLLLSLSAAQWVGAVASGLMYYGAAFWFYLIGLRSVPASVAAAFLNLIPVFTIAASYLVLDEHLSLSQWLGAIVILISVCALLVWGKRQVATLSTG
ncbi:DMT family transporter [Inquilinus sp. Marseille-Q2685]|uniref:DMT family transporter n=1 Tax=Inquilinus sp. Marseille-Q2685 TaxID=2866581 RepID=UPI001CE4113D|nr:DMT family transporter [Inquilinus sp. Marseille-Q2685]